MVVVVVDVHFGRVENRDDVKNWMSLRINVYNQYQKAEEAGQSVNQNYCSIKSILLTIMIIVRSFKHYNGFDDW